MHEGCVGESLQARLVLARVEKEPAHRRVRKGCRGWRHQPR